MNLFKINKAPLDIYLFCIMPSKRRRIGIITTRQRKKIQEFPLELEKIDSDIRTIPNQTFGKIYSTEIIEDISSPNPSSIIASSRKNKSMKKKNQRKLSKT